MKEMILPEKFISELRALRPTTHEVGGILEVNAFSEVIEIVHVEGEKCRDEFGRLLKGKICTVLHPSGPIVWHTHPRANRPSSTDLRLSLEMDHKVNLVVSHLGLWAYAPSEKLRKRYAALSVEDKRCAIKEFRFLGHMQQEATQSGNCEGMLEWMREKGFIVQYHSYDRSGPFKYEI